jgi:hypothetical protein
MGAVVARSGRMWQKNCAKDSGLRRSRHDVLPSPAYAGHPNEAVRRDMALTPSFVLAPRTASTATLMAVSRGVYVMQAREEPRLFRFGQIGAGKGLNSAPDGRNNAAMRLAQCGGTWRTGPGGSTAAGFAFVMLCHLPDAEKAEVKAVEAALRAAFEIHPRYDNSLAVKRYRDKKRRAARELALLQKIDAFMTDGSRDHAPLIAAQAQAVIERMAAAGG